jgi:hypothetical protein
MLSEGSLEHAWLCAKGDEEEARARRLEIEEALLAKHQVDANRDGTVEIVEGLKITCRITRKVDADRLQEIAAENGLSEHLSTLFRWKPDIDARAWKAAHRDITSVLEQAIESRPSKPSFSYKQKTENKK